MIVKLAVGFVLISLAELCIFVAYAKQFGIIPIMIWTILTAVAGLHLVKRCGLSTWPQFKQELWEGNLPNAELLNKLVLVVSGVCLVVPGIATDILGLALLLPGIRSFILELAPRRLARMMENGDIRLFQWRS